MYFNYFPSVHQILSVLMVSVVYWTIWVVGSNPTVFCINFFFALNWRELYCDEHFQIEISSKCDIKAQNSSIWCKCHEGRKGLRPMGSNADHFWIRNFFFLDMASVHKYPVNPTYESATVWFHSLEWKFFKNEFLGGDNPRTDFVLFCFVFLWGGGGGGGAQIKKRFMNP